jgi:hypothetical protein
MRTRSVLTILAISISVNPLMKAAARAESYDVPAESSQPSSDGLVSGAPGLVGIFYGHLPKDGHPRQKVLLTLFSDPKSGAPNGYTLEQVGVVKGNFRHITKGNWSLIKDQKRPDATIYELDSQAPADLRHFWAIDRSSLLVLENDLKVRRSGFGDPYTVAYALYARHCAAGQSLKDCSDE